MMSLEKIFGFFYVAVVVVAVAVMCAHNLREKVFYYTVRLGVREIEYVFIFKADFASNLFKPF